MRDRARSTEPRRLARRLNVIDEIPHHSHHRRPPPVPSDADRRARFLAIADDVYEPLQRYLGRRAPHDDRTELLDDVLLVIWRRLDDVPTADPLPWAYGVARRCLANHRRGVTRRLRLVDKVVAARADRSAGSLESGSIDAAPVDAEPDPLLAAALLALPDADRELLRLWAWEQLEPREIATALDTTANAVSLRLTRAKKKLESAIIRQSDGAAGHEPGGDERVVQP